MRDAVLLRGLRGGNLEVRVLRLLLAVCAERDDGVAAHLHHAAGLAHRPRAAAPLIGHDDLLAVVAEPGGVPALEMLVSVRAESRTGFSGFEMSTMMEWLEHAAASRCIAGYAVTSWQLRGPVCTGTATGARRVARGAATSTARRTAVARRRAEGLALRRSPRGR